MNMSITNLSLPLTIIWYHLCYGILTFTAYLLNKSFTLQHPNRMFPSNITPPWNTTIHSFIPTGRTLEHLSTYYPLPPPERRWLNAPQLLERDSKLSALRRAITLEGT